MERSVYQLIMDNINGDGRLDPGFSLPPSENEKGIIWAPGAFDGVYIYHMPPAVPDAEEMEKISEALNCASNDEFDRAGSLFADITARTRAVSVIDELQRYIIDHIDQLDPNNIFQFAMHMVLGSDNAECVKIGLELFEVFDITEESIKNIIRNIGLYDEFTLYSVWNMMRWNNGNKEIFELAKKVHGWGRIHAVERIEPVNDEIRDWLLKEGCKNDVMSAYSALTCWEKSGAEDILKGTPSESQYKGLLLLIEGLLDEGPVAGISALDNSEVILGRILDISDDYVLTADEYEMIYSVRRWTELKGDSMISVREKCDSILRSDKCAGVIRDSVRNGEALRLADSLGIPFHKELYDCMERDFDKFYPYCGYLLKDPDYFDKTLDLFRSNLPLDEMIGKPVEGPGLGEEFDKYNKLQMVVQELSDNVMGGTDLVYVALRSPLTRVRSQAVATMNAWTVKAEQPLSSLSKDLYDILHRAYSIEIYPEVKKNMAVLIKGMIGSGEENNDQY